MRFGAQTRAQTPARPPHATTRSGSEGRPRTGNPLTTDLASSPEVVREHAVEVVRERASTEGERPALLRGRDGAPAEVCGLPSSGTTRR